MSVSPAASSPPPAVPARRRGRYPPRFPALQRPPRLPESPRCALFLLVDAAGTPPLPGAPAPAPLARILSLRAVPVRRRGRYPPRFPALQRPPRLPESPRCALFLLVDAAGTPPRFPRSSARPACPNPFVARCSCSSTRLVPPPLPGAPAPAPLARILSLRAVPVRRRGRYPPRFPALQRPPRLPESPRCALFLLVDAAGTPPASRAPAPAPLARILSLRAVPLYHYNT
ncbi:hypothetical protein B0H15DRAFT_942280 [Mycena belliarum]|uniref:Uncharacterized protein n=1 Tax=Mycena belliarum TaxID=1033014 RepID=A0AAD6ULW1_9AGAR|nr:hypothetical protein B0H15DRAFT_942280 [Mycena belliae]